jgi:hypothetical protein
MKNTIYLFLGLLVITISSCEDSTNNSNSNTQLAAKQEQIMQEANRELGMPAIKNFQERKLMKMILELRDQENLICYAYIVAEMTVKLVFIGKCVGYGIPYATQYTNPEKEVYAGGYNQGFGVLPQADPNGLFMPSNAEGTWIMMVDPDTKEVHPIYVEPRVIISPFKLQ